ncbi:MAG: hypothetical protein M1565_05640 [Actinobacteria bacterium]|nr:hypothetical protein [Actinomycetota bacterium]
MNHEIQLISDGDGLAIIGDPTDVERFLLDQDLDRTPSRDFDLHRLAPLLGTGGAAVRFGSELAANSGRWVKLTAESAGAVKKYGLTATKTPGVSHAMIGKPGEIKQWLQIAQGPGMLLGGPMALVGLSAMMQQQAMQQQMDEIVEYLQEINEKVDDILRCHKDAVLADMIGVDLVIEDSWTVRDQVGRVSEVTWSKIQGTSVTIARTQAYTLRQLDAIAEKLSKKTDPGEMAKAAQEAEPEIREWLAVLAHCLVLQDKVSVLELDRVLEVSPEDLDRHRVGLTTARHKRRELVAGTTFRLLNEMDETVRKANSKVLFNPFKSPAAVRSCNQITTNLLDFRDRLEIESAHETSDARGWGQAAGDVRDRVVTSTAEGADAARRFGAATFDQAAGALRAVDVDGDGIPDKPRALVVAEDAGSAIKGAAAGAAGAIGVGASTAGSAVGGLAAGGANAVRSLLRRKQSTAASPDGLVPKATDPPPGSPDA